MALIPQIATELGLPHSFVTKNIGTVNPARAIPTENAYITALFNHFLKHGGAQLLDAPSSRYPNLTFVK